MIGVKSAVVGRERVLAELGELLAAARAGSGSVVLLTGEAGIGKSTVADVLVERARAEGVPSWLDARSRMRALRRTGRGGGRSPRPASACPRTYSTRTRPPASGQPRQRRRSDSGSAT